MTTTERIREFLSTHPDVTHVFWDYFDTIATRTVEPEYVKRLSAARLADALGNGLSAEEIYQARFRAEARLCRESADGGRDLEFRFSEMADALHAELSRPDPDGQREPVSLDREAFVQLFYDLEVGLEKQVQQAVPEVADAIRATKQAGLTNVIVSDFYLDADAERSFLAHFGLLDQFSDVFVSSTDRYVKNGGFFPQVLEKLHLKPGQVVMVGDHPIKDQQPAEKAGMYAILVGDYDGQKASYRAMLRGHLSLSAQEKKLSSIVSDAGVPFAEFSLTLYRFIARLSRAARRDGVRTLHFLSREGEFLRELFERYQQRLLPSQSIKTDYLIASRRSTFLPSLRPLDKEDFSTLLSQYYHLSAVEFLNNFGFTSEEIAQVRAECRYDFHKRQHPFAWSKVAQAVFRSPAFNRLYEEKRLGQKKEFSAYLSSLGIDSSSDTPVFLVDVGWKGTIQDHVTRAFDAAFPLHGYYMGLFHPTGVTWRNSKDGLLFAEYPLQTKYFQVYFENRTLFEVLLGASHGSPSGYADGKPVIEDKPEEQEIYTTKIRPLQLELMKLFDRVCDAMATTHFSTDDLEEYFARAHARMVFHPTDAELDFFATLRHFENFGLFEWSRFDKNDRSFAMWLRNMLRLFTNPVGTIFGGFWPALTIRHLHIPLLSWAYRTFRMWRVF